jgi:ABC-type proline/glycine betaine transport system ATPase subunit
VQLKASNYQEMNRPVHPVREEIDKVIGQYNLTAVIKEDTATLATMKHVGGLIAFICSLMKDGKVISEGRGATVLGPNNKWLTKAVENAFNSALSDAVIRSTKVLGTFLSASGSAVSLEAAYGEIEAQKNNEPSTEKQRNYLYQLITQNVDDEEEREQRLSQVDELSKQEACRMIEELKR